MYRIQIDLAVSDVCNDHACLVRVPPAQRLQLAAGSRAYADCLECIACLAAGHPASISTPLAQLWHNPRHAVTHQYHLKVMLSHTDV
jgi:hypothetical protein